MKNTKLSLIRTCTLAVVIILLVSLSATSPAQTTGDQKAAGEWKTVEDVFGFPGANLPGGVVRFNMPRKDLHVTLAGTEIKPGLALGAWAAFHHVGDNDAMVMGDLVLTEDEVAPVMKALLDGGVEVTAIHNHLIGESPHVVYVHFSGHGDAAALAAGLKKVLARTATPLAAPAAAGTPAGTAKPLPADYRDRATVEHPPGFYGPAEGPLAVNTLAAADRIAPLDTSSLRARHASYTNAEPRDLRGMLLSAALALFLIDAVIVAMLGAGIAALLRRRAAPAALAVAIMGAAMLAATLIVPGPARADSSDDFAIKATSQTRLAYVVTGNADVDSIVKAGMAGLTLFLAQRTALEAGDPVGIDPAHDELAFFPLIYWPIVPGAAKPPQDAINRIDAYMKQGGTVLFDTRDAVEAPPGENGAAQTPGMLALRNILASLDVPELEPVPREHVLTKTFYLLRDFPGRFNTGQTWVEALPRGDDDEDASRPARGGDGVSPIIITSNDLAGAWAIRPDGQPMLPLTPGEPRQREFAFRSGVNIVMYTLTGNYKADQVHAPALIERLGQ